MSEESESETELLLESDNEESSDIDDVYSSSESSDEDDDMAPARQWVPVSVSLPPSPPPRFPFTSSSKMNFTIHDTSDIMEYFSLFFDDDFFNILVTQTNLYAQKHDRNWVPTNKSEMLVFLALNILMPLVNKSVVTQYWSKRDVIETPFFCKLMKRKRFLLLKKYLPFFDDDTFHDNEHPAPKLRKIWPIVEFFNKKFSKLYTPDRDISIDESLMLFKGRLGWKQYIPLKRARFGIKSYILSESKTGYIWSFIIYTGKGTKFAPAFENELVSTRIVLTLIEPLLDQGYCLTTDNFYSCPRLAEILIRRKTDTYGTIKANRKELPPQIKKQKLRKGEIIAYQRGKLLALKWKDKKDVCLLSTVHSTTIENNKLRLVTDYNNTMGGVDRIDQQLSYYPIVRKRGKKYYKKIFFHMVDYALCNSYILYSKCGGVLKNLEFRMQMIEKICENYGTSIETTKGRRRSIPAPSRLTERHFPGYVPATQKKTNATRICVVCSKKRDERGKKVRRESRYQCCECDVGLCAAPCFGLYHTKSEV